MNARDSLKKEQKEKFDRIITEKIVNSEEFINARKVIVFASVGSEFDTGGLINRCRILNKSVFYPKCTDKKGNMKFFEVKSDADLQKGLYSIPEPKETCKEYEFSKNDIIIIPALSVDRNFYRLGYGGGYYDRFLKDFDGIGICPCYGELLTDKLPTDEFDMKVDIIVTESGIYKREVIR